MDASQFKHLLETDHYSPADLEQVNDLCRNYPMFNLAHMLKVRIRESLGYEKELELKVAAVYAADRRKLFKMVSEVSRPVEVDEEHAPMEEEGINFSTEPHPEVDVIIGQHAPYAGIQSAENDLLEIEEDPEEESAHVAEDIAGDEAEEDEGEKLEITAETLIEAVVKDVAEMEEPETGEKETPRSNSLIINFLKEDPGPIRADKFTAKNRDVSLASIREHDGFITDTLAKIYMKQGLYAKAIYAYEKLSLKYPEKSAYFAAQIEKISNINHS